MTKTKIREMVGVDLNSFTGSDSWYRHALVPSIRFTDGAKYVADAGGAYWLLDEIALAQRAHAIVGNTEFQVWTLKVNPDSTARLSCEDGDYNEVFAKDIAFTDFPMAAITFWFANDTIYLPTEH